MAIIGGISVFLSLVFLLFIIMALISPAIVPWIGRRSRGRVAGTYVLLAFVFFVGGGIMIGAGADPNPEEGGATETATAPELTKIQALEKNALAIPASDHQGNINAYSELLELDPGNKKYAKKIEHYQG